MLFWIMLYMSAIDKSFIFYSIMNFAVAKIFLRLAVSS